MCSKKLLPSFHGTRSSVAERVIKATRCDWLLATTKVDFARTLHNFRLTDSIFESVKRLLSWSGQQHTNVLASLRPAYITQLLGVSRQIIRHLGVSRLMYARHKSVCLSMLANCRSQFLLDRLGRCLKLFVSTDSTSCHECASQFGLAFF